SRRRHTRWPRDWSSDVCSSDLDDVERHPTGLRLAQPSGLMFFLRLEGQDEVGVVNILNQNTWHAAALDRLFEPVAVHRIREDTRSEERRVGKEGRSRGGTSQCK